KVIGGFARFARNAPAVELRSEGDLLRQMLGLGSHRRQETRLAIEWQERAAPWRSPSTDQTAEGTPHGRRPSPGGVAASFLADAPPARLRPPVAHRGRQQAQRRREPPGIALARHRGRAGTRHGRRLGRHRIRAEAARIPRPGRRPGPSHGNSVSVHLLAPGKTSLARVAILLGWYPSTNPGGNSGKLGVSSFFLALRANTTYRLGYGTSTPTDRRGSGLPR